MDKTSTLLITEHGSNLAAGFAEFIKRLSLQLGGRQDAAGMAGEAAASIVQALSAGDVCIDIRTLAKSFGQSEEDARALLFSSNVTATGEEECKLPLVCDDKGRIYLYRYFDYERQLAGAVVARISSVPPQSLQPEVRKFLDEYFAENEKRLAGRSDRQKMAVEMAIINPLTIISGGPGTGKTTIVTAVLAALALHDPSLRIALAAPTGKAAARMEDALRRQMKTLDPVLRERLPDRASTIHRLLGVRPESEDFCYHRDNPLPYDVIVVDEASMIDLSLAARLFTALPNRARIVLLGDKDQLAAVEAGAVFAELARHSSINNAENDGSISMNEPMSAESRKRGVPDCVVWLKENYRFRSDSPIGKLAELVVTGDDHQLADWLTHQKDGEIHWETAGIGLPASVVETIIRRFEPYVAAVRKGDPLEVMAAYEQFCVLCAVRHGKRGVDGMNEVIMQKLRRQMSGGASHDSFWYHGRPVMITQNDYNLEIFNGDIGIALTGKDGNLEVWFRTKDGNMRSVSPWSLPENQTAFAITVHKAQGSEFQNVAFVLPEHDSPVLTRELIYTAVTRAKKSLSIYGSLELVKASVCRPTCRRGGLAARILLEIENN